MKAREDPFIELEIEQGDAVRTVLLSGTDLSVGRHDECDLVLKVDGLSRWQFRLYCDSGAWWAERHPQSSQDTWVDDTPLDAPRRLVHGTVIECASIRLTVGTSRVPARGRALQGPASRAAPPSEPPPARPDAPAMHVPTTTVDFDDGDWAGAGPDPRAVAAEAAARHERLRRTIVLGSGITLIAVFSAYLLWPEPPPPPPPAAPEKDLCELPFLVDMPAVCAAPPECARLASESLARARRIIETAQADPARRWDALSEARSAILMGEKADGLFSEDQMRAAAEIADRVSRSLKSLCLDVRYQKSVALRAGRYREAQAACRTLLAHIPDPKDPRFGWARECIADVEKMASQP